MPLTQKAPREPGCAGFGAIFVTLPSSMVRSEPHSAEHSQQVEGTISRAGRLGRTFIARSLCGGYTRAMRAQVGIRRVAGMTDPDSRFFQSQGLRLHYWDWGNADAPLLLLVHGGRDHARSWDL